ncbi:hypothetical protein ACFL5Z_20285 [Planctomycetota bacterium]
MAETKRFDVKRLAIGAILAVVIVAIGLLLARIDRNQSTLQTVVEANTQQIATIATRIEKKMTDKMAAIEQSQQDMQAGIEAMQSDTQKLTADITAVIDEQATLNETVQNNSQKLTSNLVLIEQNRQEWQTANKSMRANIRQVAANATAVGEEQIKLNETMQNSSQQMTDKIAVIEQSQQDLQAGIEAVQSDTRKLTADITAIIGEQAKLYEMVQNNSQKLTSNLALIEQNQKEWQGAIEGVREDIQQVAVNTTSVGEEQRKLNETVQNSSQQMNSKMAVIKQSQNALQTGIDDVQTDARKLAADMTAVRDEQAKLHVTVQDNSQQLKNNLALIEQNQQEWQEEIDSMGEYIQQVAARISTLGESLSKSEEMLQNKLRELVDMMDGTAQEQLKLQGKTRKDLQALDDSVSAIKQRQNRLQNQITDVQDNAEIMGNDLQEALEQLEDELSRSGILARPDIVEAEPPEPSSLSLDPNNVE